MTNVEQDERFYFETLIFLVELDTLFKIPQIYFERTSSAFGSMFSLPPSPGDVEQEGSSNQNPIRLDGIKKTDFQCLLFPDLNKFAKTPLTMGVAEWTSVLKLSTMWSMRELRYQAIDKLQATFIIDPLEKVFLAREYKVGKWLVEAYTELVKRERPLSTEESRKLGLETAIQIYKAREDTFKLGLECRGTLAPLTWQCQYCAKFGVRGAIPVSHPPERVYTSLRTTILKAFEDELKDIEYGEEAVMATEFEAGPDLRNASEKQDVAVLEDALRRLRNPAYVIKSVRGLIHT